MFVTGPWNLSDFPDAKYGVQVMPMFAGGSHDTIAGPDAWVVMDNGDGARRRGLEAREVPDLARPGAGRLARHRASADAHRRSATCRASAPFATSFPGIDVFAQNLVNVKKARPSIATYPQISQAIGNAVTSVVLGKAEPQQALDDAAQQADTFLATG